MDASLVLTKPAPAPTTTANAPTFEPEQTDDDFAAHLPPDEAPRPPTRKPVLRDARASDDTTKSADEKTEDKAPEDCATLTAPSAPALVRPQNSVVTFDLSAVVAQGASDAPSVGPKAPVPAPAPQTPAAATALPAPPSPQATAVDDTAEATPVATEAALNATASALKSLETIALPVTAAASADSRAQPKLRTGRSEAVDEKGAEKKASPYAGIEVATSTKGAAKVETPFAVQATTATATAHETLASGESAPTAALAAPSDHRAHQLNEAVGAAGHRATTPTALVAQHIIRRFDGKSTSIDVRLDPAELGRVQVSLEVGADNKVTAVVAAENPSTLADLVRSARELERALQDAGLELSSGGLSFDLAERGDNNTSDEKSSDARGSGRSDPAAETSAPPPSRPFGLESWRGARVDVMV